MGHRPDDRMLKYMPLFSYAVLASTLPEEELSSLNDFYLRRDGPAAQITITPEEAIYLLGLASRDAKYPNKQLSVRDKFNTIVKAQNLGEILQDKKEFVEKIEQFVMDDENKKQIVTEICRSGNASIEIESDVTYHLSLAEKRELSRKIIETQSGASLQDTALAHIIPSTTIGTITTVTALRAAQHSNELG